MFKSSLVEVRKRLRREIGSRGSEWGVMVAEFIREP